MSRLNDLTGQRFGKLVVLRRGRPLYHSSTNATWICLCDCGSTTTVYAPSLTRGLSTTCGSGPCRRMALKDRFDKFAYQDPHSDCVLWRGCHTSQGYAQLGRVDSSNKASHVALQLDGRQVPKGMCACHHCDNPGCVNAKHLFIGTHKDNVQDMMNKGRHDFSGLDLGRPLGSKAASAAARAKREAA